MVPSSERGAGWVVIGNPGSRRLTLFQQALTALGRPPAVIVPYLDLIAGCLTLEAVVRPGDIVRLESPGQDFAVEKALLAAGADEPDDPGPTRLSRAAVERLVFDKGRILAPRQWYLGFAAVLRRIEAQLRACPPHQLTTPPDDVALMFDKNRSQERFAAAGIPVPEGLGPMRCYEELRERMRQTGHRRVFVKLAHGSSASGVAAYETAGPREQAITSVEMVRTADGLRLYNSRRIRTLRDFRDIRCLIDALLREGARVERWVPKAGLDGCACDLRVVVIAGQPRHTVVRLSRGPMTNLHLKNRRGDPSAVRERLGADGWAALRATCQQAATLFSHSLQCAFDVVIPSGWRRHLVVEVNAFGDLLPGILDDGEDTYTAELRAGMHSIGGPA